MQRKKIFLISGLDENTFPLPLLSMTFPISHWMLSFTNDSNHLMEKYDVKGSAASQQLKDFMYAFTDKLKNIYDNNHLIDSLKNVQVHQIVFFNLAIAKQAKAVADIKILYSSNDQRIRNPSLTMFELGYYQTTANNPTI